MHLAQSFNASKFKVFTKIRLPNSLPFIFSGLKVASTVAVTGAIVGEFIASERGLATVMIAAQSTLVTEAMFAALIWISLLGVGLYGVVTLVEQLVMPWERRGK